MERSREIELVQRARAGDAASFEHLVNSHAARLLTLARRLVGDHHLAEDLVQEAFLRLHHHLGSFRGDSSVATWLYRIVSRLAIDHFRREKIRQRLFFNRTSNDAPDPVASAADPAPTPDGVLAAHELSEVLARAVTSLSARQRAIFVLRHHEGLPIREIAAILKLEEGTVKAHLHRALTALRRTLRRYRDIDA